MALMIVVAQSPSYHSVCTRATTRCFVRCRSPRRNCIKIDEWLSSRGLEDLPEAARGAPEMYFFYLRAAPRP